jgi:hypothetical protein
MKIVQEAKNFFEIANINHCFTASLLIAMKIVQDKNLFEIANINHRFVASLLYYFFFVKALRQLRRNRDAMKRKNVYYGV